MNRDILIDVARTSLSTKVDKEIAEILTEVHYVFCLVQALLLCGIVDSGGCSAGDQTESTATHRLAHG